MKHFLIGLLALAIVIFVPYYMGHQLDAFDPLGPHNFVSNSVTGWMMVMVVFALAKTMHLVAGWIRFVGELICKAFNWE